MANNPITQRVKAAFSKLTFPVNQEVTLNADGTGGPIISPSGHVGKAPSCACGKKKACDCGGSPNKMGCGSPAKQTKKPRFTDKLYEKAAKLQSKADKAASEGKNKKAARLENRVARVEKREKKKRAKYNY